MFKLSVLAESKMLASGLLLGGLYYKNFTAGGNRGLSELKEMLGYSKV